MGFGGTACTENLGEESWPQRKSFYISGKKSAAAQEVTRSLHNQWRGLEEKEEACRLNVAHNLVGQLCELSRKVEKAEKNEVQNSRAFIKKGGIREEKVKWKWTKRWLQGASKTW